MDNSEPLDSWWTILCLMIRDGCTVLITLSPYLQILHKGYMNFREPIAINIERHVRSGQINLMLAATVMLMLTVIPSVYANTPNHLKDYTLDRDDGTTTLTSSDPFYTSGWIDGIRVNLK